jgi:hypothetical protein
MLQAIGWAHPDGRPIDVHSATGAAWGTRAVLRRLGALTRRNRRDAEQPTPDGVTFARTALRTWPAGA